MIANALAFGLLLSLVLGALMAASAALAPDVWLSDYPPDVRAKFGAMSPRAARLRWWVAVPFLSAFLGVPLLALASLEDRFGPVAFLPALASSYVVLLVFNLFDLLVVDWLVFCTLRPRWIVLPGTEGLAGYRDYRFHFVAFLKGLVLCAVAALVVATIWTGGRASLGRAVARPIELDGAPWRSVEGQGGAAWQLVSCSSADADLSGRTREPAARSESSTPCLRAPPRGGQTRSDARFVRWFAFP